MFEEAYLHSADFELYNDLASHFLVKAIYLRKREKRTANALAKQTVHSFFVLSA